MHEVQSGTTRFHPFLSKHSKPKRWAKIFWFLVSQSQHGAGCFELVISTCMISLQTWHHLYALSFMSHKWTRLQIERDVVFVPWHLERQLARCCKYARTVMWHGRDTCIQPKWKEPIHCKTKERHAVCLVYHHTLMVSSVIFTFTLLLLSYITSCATSFKSCLASFFPILR